MSVDLGVYRKSDERMTAQAVGMNSQDARARLNIDPLSA